MPSQQKHYERLEMRIQAENKLDLQRAAAMRGQSLTDFVLQAALERAETTIQAQTVIRLNAEASKLFAEMILNPPAPNAKLKKAAQRHGR
jgi:uncharacterized protein (DUF1778 family)